MQLNKVTITGADDSTDLRWMMDIQKQYPFVEWGILVSKKSMGSYRFPSARWLGELIRCQDDLKTSIHVCGEWVRQICKGQWAEFLVAVGSTANHAQRIQLNFHNYAHTLEKEFFERARVITMNQRWQIIFQVDKTNAQLVSHAMVSGLNAVPLYDLSGGAGILPEHWPQQLENIYSGYAGGLGPENVIEQVEKIKTVANGLIWIDMETRVRTPDDSKLDTSAVESVLRQCSDLDCLIK